MKRIAVAILMVGMLVFAGSAMATTTTECPGPGCTWSIWNLTDNPSDFKITSPNSYNHIFDITTLGYEAAYDQVVFATLKIWTYDDGGRYDGSESASITIDADTFYLNLGYAWGWVSGYLQDGLLNVTITATSGDFMYDKMILESSGWNCPAPNAVPEPTTMLLLGFGLAGVAVARKKFRK